MSFFPQPAVTLHTTDYSRPCENTHQLPADNDEAPANNDHMSVKHFLSERLFGPGKGHYRESVVGPIVQVSPMMSVS